MTHINIISKCLALLLLLTIPSSLPAAGRALRRFAPVALSTYAFITRVETSLDAFDTDFGCSCYWKCVEWGSFGDCAKYRHYKCDMHSEARERKEKNKKKEEKLLAFYGTLSMASFTSIEIDAALQVSFPKCFIESPHFSWAKSYITNKSLRTHDYYEMLVFSVNSYMSSERVTLRASGHLCENEAECRRIHVVLGQQEIFACLRTLLMNRPNMLKELAKVKTQPYGEWLDSPIDN